LSSTCTSVATAKANVFDKNGIIMGMKFVIILKLFDEMEDHKNWGII
jgi:hypothetical protein